MYADTGGIATLSVQYNIDAVHKIKLINLFYKSNALFPVYFNVNYWNKMEFYVKCAIFSILK